MDSSAQNNESIRFASDQLTELVTETKKTADCFRFEDESEANQRLVVLVEAFQKFVEILGLLKKARNLDFPSITVDGKSLAEWRREMTTAFHQILEAQNRKDWTSLADLLEHKMAPILTACSRFLRTLTQPSETEPDQTA